MTQVLVLVEVRSETFERLSKEEKLQYLKKHMGGYNDHDIARLVEVLETEAA